MALMSNRSWADWIAEYGRAHTHPVNRSCHTVGIPLIAGSVVLFVAAVAVPRLWIASAGLFIAGWALQLIGHAYEGKPPEFLKDGRFLFVGLRWWFEKTRGRA
jgi:uncharacterized membrane protein YGL010W